MATSPNTSPRNLPSKIAIRKHWSARLWQIKSYDSEFEFLEADTCFACGFTGTERCHILARVAGGDDSAENLHLLCSTCHKDSEYLESEIYNDWLYERTVVDCILSMGVKQGFNLSRCVNFSGDHTGERTRAAMAYKKSLGQGLGGTNPFGHDLADDGKTLVENRREQAAIQLIIMLREDGLSFQKIADLLTRKKIRTKEGSDAWTPTTVMRIFKRTASDYSKSTSERTRDALQHKRRMGKRAGQLPYGFNLAEDGDTLILNSREHAIVELMTLLREDGLSYHKIAAILQRKRVPTKEPGSTWAAMTVRNILIRTSLFALQTAHHSR